MKNKKMKLEDLKVNSFVTEINTNMIKGGAESIVCLTGVYPTLPVQACATDTTSLFTNNLTQNICN
jgi:hypothetical protein